MFTTRTTVSQDVQTWISVHLAFAKFLSKIKGNFWGSAEAIHDTGTVFNFSFILDRNLAKANCTENHVCTSCDTVVLGSLIKFSSYLYSQENFVFQWMRVFVASKHNIGVLHELHPDHIAQSVVFFVDCVNCSIWNLKNKNWTTTVCTATVCRRCDKTYNLMS